MKFSLAATTLAIAGFASAAPGWPASYPYAYGYSQPAASPSAPPSSTKPSAAPAYSYTPPVECLTNKTAKALVDGFVSLITNYNAATADALLSKDFTDTSDSINVMTNPPTPLGSATFPSKDAFKAGQGAQPAVPMSVINIDEVTCTNVAFRWVATPNPGMPDLKVKGINSFEASNLNKTDAGWQIKTMYSEFNNCVWIRAIGGTCKMPGA